MTEEREHAISFFMILGRKQYSCLAMFAVTRFDAAGVPGSSKNENEKKYVTDLMDSDMGFPSHPFPPFPLYIPFYMYHLPKRHMMCVHFTLRNYRL